MVKVPVRELEIPIILVNQSYLSILVRDTGRGLGTTGVGLSGQPETQTKSE